MLPELAPELPAPIPGAAYSGPASARFPWAWFGSRLIAGREVALAGLDPDRRGKLAAELGQFLGCLQSLRPAIATALAIDPMGRADMNIRVPRTRAALEQVTSLWDGGERSAAVLDAAETPLTGRSCGHRPR